MRMVGSGYQLRTLIGSGSTGEVWAGQTGDGRPVAVKILNSELTADLDAVGRFVREGQILTSVRSPNLVWVHDLIAGEDTLAIVMDLVNGPDLHTYLRQHGPIAPALAAELIGQVLDALAVVHHAGIIHRDIKPENILIDLSESDRPCALLSDFGIAMITQDPAENGTGVAGTLPYLAPELIQNGRASSSCDLYSTGVVLFELLAGRPPFVSDDPYELIRAHQEDQPARIPGLPAAMQALIDGLLAKDPAARPPSAVAAHQLLTQASAGLPAEPLPPLPLPLPLVGEGYRGPTIPPTGALPTQQNTEDVAGRAVGAAPGVSTAASVPAALAPAGSFDASDTAKLVTIWPGRSAPRPEPESDEAYAAAVPSAYAYSSADAPGAGSATGGPAFAGGLFDTGLRLDERAYHEPLPPGGEPWLPGGEPWPPREQDDRNRWWMVPVGLGLAAVAGLVAVVFTITGGGSTPPAGSTTPPAVALPTASTEAPVAVATQEPTIEPTVTTPPPSPTPTVTPSASPAATVSASVPPKPATITMPRLTGRSLAAANAALSARGLGEASYSLTCSGPAPEGQVLTQTPSAGSAVSASAAISVTVQDDCAIVPNVRGRSLNAATRELRAAGFTNIMPVSRGQVDPSTAIVVGQVPSGTSQKKTTTIYLQIANGGGGGGPN